MYLVNFQLRKVERRTDLFDDIERQFSAEKDPVQRKNAEQIYDQVLDVLYQGML